MTRRSRSLVVDALRRWRELRGMQLGAALAFYALLSLAPLLSIIAAGSGALVGEEVARVELTRQLEQILGPQGAAPVGEFIRDIRPTAGTRLGALATLALLAWSAHLVFTQLKLSLDVIWNVKPRRHPLVHFIVVRLGALAMILAVVALLAASVALTTAVSALARWAPHVLPGPATYVHVIDFLVSVLLITLLLAAVYKILPDAPVRWGDVWSGAFGTGVLLVCGKSLLGIYLSNTDLGSVYGAAVGIAGVLIAVFFYAELLLFGALLTALRAGRRR